MKTIKYFSIAIFTIASLNLNAQFKINGSGKTETEMWAHGNFISRYWTVNYLSSYSFGVDATAIGNIWNNINATNPTRLFSFSDSWINGYNFQYSSFGKSRHNRFHQSNTGSFGEAFGFNFNPNQPHGLIIENAYSEGSGMYFDGDYAVLWSPGDQNRLLRIYDEDGMIEKAYIDGNGYYHKNSDGRRKENVNKLNSISALEGVRKIRGVEYNHIQDVKIHKTPEILEETINGHVVNTYDVGVKIKDENDKKYYGFIAQEVEEIFPDVVKTDEHGNRFMDYTEVIPILVEAIKELDFELERIKEEMLKEKSKLKSESINDFTTDVYNIIGEEAKLYQNSPNPFTTSTKIHYYLPENYNSASIFIYNMQGNQIKRVFIQNYGNSSITINGYELNAGMYFYTLIADGQAIDTKRMILID